MWMIVQKRKFSLICSIFCQFQPGVAYKIFDHKKRVQFQGNICHTYFKKEIFVAFYIKSFLESAVKVINSWQDFWTCQSDLYWALGVGEWNHVEYNGVYVWSSIFRTLHNFSKGFFSMYRGTLEVKNYTSILHTKLARSQIRRVAASLHCLYRFFV